MNNPKEKPSGFGLHSWLPFSRVPFVIETENDCLPEAASQTPRSSVCSQLNGASISQFYNQIISEPSVATPAVTDVKKIQSQPKKREISQISLSNIIESRDKTENSCKVDIHRLAQDGDIVEIQNCIKNKCNLNAIDLYGWTPLMCAVSAGHLNVVECLLQHGTDLEIRSHCGLTALDIAKKQGCSSKILNLLLNPFQTRTIKLEPVTTIKTKKSIFCRICNKKYEDSVESHERSIAHLFNCKPKVDKTFYHIPEHNKGYQIMLKKGWDADGGLGPDKAGRKYPIKTVLRTDRSCIGTKGKDKQRITHFGPNDVSAVKVRTGLKLQPAIEREKTLKKREREKIERKNRHKEIAFRRDFNVDL